jgi:hypothetical protein
MTMTPGVVVQVEAAIVATIDAAEVGAAVEVVVGDITDKRIVDELRHETKLTTIRWRCRKPAIPNKTPLIFTISRSCTAPALEMACSPFTSFEPRA